MGATRSAKKAGIGEVEWDRVHPADLEELERLQARVEAATSDAEREKFSARLVALYTALETRPPGRPRVLSPEQEAQFRATVGLPDYATRRTVQNRANWGRALKLLCDGPMATVVSTRWVWLLRPNRDGVATSRKTILSELGRVKDDEALKVFADALCERKPAAQDAIRLLRRWRGRLDAMLVTRIVECEEKFAGPDETEDAVAMIDRAELARIAVLRVDAG